MSIHPTEVYVLHCDHCGDREHHEDLGGVLVHFTAEDAATSIWATQPEEDEWCRVGNAHFCYSEACQDAARKAIRELPQPVPVLPGQLALIGEVDGVPVPYEVLP